MTAKELREALQGVPDETPVLITGAGDHGYLEPSEALLMSVGKSEYRWTEWDGEWGASPGEIRVDGFVICTE